MPLFKGEGCKSYPSKAINYITDKNKAKIISSQNLNDNKSYSKQFQDTARLYKKGNKFDERKYYHFKLSCNRFDNVSPEDHHKYAEEMVKKLFSNYECVIATHTDTETVHSHIIVNAVNFENGRKLHCSDKEYTAMKDLVNEIGIERGYSITDFRKPSQAKDRIATKERLVVAKGRTSWKEELREVIAEAKAKTTNMTDFEKHLNDYGITLTRNTEKNISYLHPKKKKAIRGEKLGQDYTKGEILNVINKQQREHTNIKGQQSRTTTNITRTDNTINESNIVSKDEPIRSRIDESGKRTTQTDIRQLEHKLREIREIDNRYNPEEQRRIKEEQRRIKEKHERAKRDAELKRKELENSKRRIEQEHKIRNKSINRGR